MPVGIPFIISLVRLLRLLGGSYVWQLIIFPRLPGEDFNELSREPPPTRTHQIHSHSHCCSLLLFFSLFHWARFVLFRFGTLMANWLR